MTLQDLRTIVEGNTYLLKNATQSQTIDRVHTLINIRDRILKQEKKRFSALLEYIDGALVPFTKGKSAEETNGVYKDYSDMSPTSCAFLLFFAGFYSYSMVAWFSK